MQRFRRKQAKPEELEGYADGLRRAGHLDTTEGYTHVLRQVEFGEHWEWGLRLLEEAWERLPAPGPDVITHNVACQVFGRAGEWPRALNVLEEMRARGVQMDFETTQAATQACSRNGQWEQALAVLVDAQENGVADRESYNIAMMACGSAKAWETSLALLESAGSSTVPELARDALAFGIAAYGCYKAGLWQKAVSLLATMQAEEVTPDAVVYACCAQACKQAKEAKKATGLLEEMRYNNLDQYSVQDVLGESEWVLEGPEMRHPVPLSALAEMAGKEAKLYKWVVEKATRGDIDSVLKAIEDFADARSWLKIQGEDKRALLEKEIKAGDRIVEFGCYVGYSSLFMGRRLRQLGGTGSVTTIEVDAAVAYIARGIHNFAGAQDICQVRVGCACDWLATGQLGEIDLLLMDHRGTIYHDDLHAAEPYLAPNGRALVDNVLYPGAPLFLHYIDVMGYDIEIHELKEFLRVDLDDWVVICRPTKRGLPPPEEYPAEFRRLSAEVDAISWRSQNEAVDWLAWQEVIKPAFYKWKEEMSQRKRLIDV